MKQTDTGIELNSFEAGQVIWLWALKNQLFNPERAEPLRALAKAAGKAIQFGQLKYAAEQVTDTITTALSPEQNTRLLHTMKSHCIQLATNAGYGKREADYLIVIHKSDLHSLMEWARQWFGCDLCIKDGKEAKKCELRKLLIGVSAPDENADFNCEYGGKP